MIFLLLPLRWMFYQGGGGPAPAGVVFVAFPGETTAAAQAVGTSTAADLGQGRTWTEAEAAITTQTEANRVV